MGQRGNRPQSTTIAARPRLAVRAVTVAGATPITVSQAELKELYARRLRAMTKRPELARAARICRVRLGDGLACRVEHLAPGDVVDLPPAAGGAGGGPSPDDLVLAGFAASLAQGYRVWAARLDVALLEINLEMVCEFDERGQLGMEGNVAVGWQRLLTVTAAISPASPAQVARVIDRAHRFSPVLASLAKGVEQIHRLSVIAPDDS